MAKKPGQLLKKFKKNIPSLAICFSIVCGSYYLLLHHYPRFGSGSDVVSMLETTLLDYRFTLRGISKPSGKVGILAIDEESIQRFGRWPFSRRYYEKALENLKKHGVKVIGFDAVFSEPERPLLVDAKPQMERLRLLKRPEEVISEVNRMESLLKASPADEALARGIENFGGIVGGYFYYSTPEEAAGLGEEKFRGMDLIANSAILGTIFPEGATLENYPNFTVAGVVGNTDYIASKTPHFAFFNNDADGDAIVRWVTLVKNVQGNLMPSLSLKTAAEAMGREIVVFFDDNGVEEVALVNPDNDQDIIKVPVDPMGLGRILINHYGPGTTINHYSLADAYDDTFTPEQVKSLKGMIMLLGPTAIGINDQRPNPFDPGINGVENHAAVVDNIVKGRFMQRPLDIYKTELLIILAIGLLFSPLMIFSSASFSGIAALLFAIGYYYFDKYYWFSKGIWAYMGMPYIEITALFVGITLYKYMTEEREKKKVKGVFDKYLSPDVIKQVLDDPESLKLGGERQELTVFFSDVRGFTTISESLTPEKLCDLMNEYFTPMTSIILQSGGVLDKYIGDAIMAFWGAPIHFVDHADRAAVSSIQMLYALEKLREELPKKGFPKIDIGIGLNTGSMSVGNMGSAERFCYTVMGDSVNLGSRLEGLTKEYGIKIMISESTRNKITRKDLFVRDLDDIRVKGKNEPVKVFDLMKPDLLKSEQAMRDLVGEFELGRHAYRARDFKKAREHFTKCLSLRPDDGPTEVYLERLDHYAAEPPVQDWDGVYTFTHK